ncbi:FtsH protease activity modulator HflK [Fastidiosibacter lacustris]|uniref:FtsH protease activity modulator HflK n=1 Tax=Fastidiosibacter lacustris TaxID=2056695 RepID=UPI000E34EBA8|nr:FtsH protease activity modulator HflK [Fastidiosibacter lacustris]
MAFKFLSLNKVFNQGPPDLEEAIRRFLGKGRKSNQGNDSNHSSNDSPSPNIGGNGQGSEPPKKDNNRSIYSRNVSQQKPLPVKRIIVGVAVTIIVVWAAMGIYVVQPAQQAAVLAFGKFSSVEGSGMHWHPPGFVSVIKKDVEVLNTIKLDKQMLTSEENIVHVSFSVQYRIANLEKYLFATNNPELILRQSLESAVRQVVGENKLEKILTTSRTQITLEVQKELEKLLQKYQTGILVSEVIMQPAQAPSEVKSAFDDVIKAREDRERIQNEAQSYANKVVPVAKGKAQRILDEARAYQEKVVLEAQGNVANFSQLLPVYQQNPNIIESQLYYQTMENIFKNNKLYIVDGDGAKNIFYGDKLSPVALSSTVQGGR